LGPVVSFISRLSKTSTEAITTIGPPFFNFFLRLFF
jgi:hypothetical protein